MSSRIKNDTQSKWKKTGPGGNTTSGTFLVALQNDYFTVLLYAWLDILLNAWSSVLTIGLIPLVFRLVSDFGIEFFSLVDPALDNRGSR